MEDMRVPASVRGVVVGVGCVVVMGATGCSKNVETTAAAESARTADLPADVTPTETPKAALPAVERDNLAQTDLRTPIRETERSAGANAWMFRGGESVEEPNARPASITPPPPPPVVTQPPKPQPPKPVVTTQPDRPTPWSVRAACGRG